MLAILLLGVMLVLIMVGVPIAFAIGLSASFFLEVTGMRPQILLPQRLLVGINSFALIAVPLFTFSGYLMEQGGLSKRLVDWVEKIFGWFPGSMGTITILCCTIFASLTGSGPATVAAIGAIMFPAMISGGYSRETAAGLLAAGGSLGPIIPPSVAMIVYGSTMSLSIPNMFLAAIIPGLLLAFLFIVVNTVIAFRKNIKPVRQTFTRQEFLRSTVSASGVILLPVIVLGGIYGGVFTPTEAAAVCVIYSLFLGMAFRELTWKKVADCLKLTARTSAMVILICGMSAIFGWILAAAKIPTTIATAVLPYLSSPEVYLIILMFFLFFVGCLMETLSSIVILAPILVPIGIQLGVDPLHLGVLFCINLVIGFITPPFGVNIFTACSVTGQSFPAVVKGLLPFLLVAMAAVMVFAFVPGITLFFFR